MAYAWLGDIAFAHFYFMLAAAVNEVTFHQPLPPALKSDPKS